MPSEREQLIAVSIFNVYPYCDEQQGAGTPPSFLVFLKGDENRVVPITIGQFEGQALAMALRRVPLPRPLPHHLLNNLLERIRARVHKLVIHSLREEVFHAYLLVQTQEETFCLDCRPSDGMIIATLADVPIYISTQVMAEAGKVLDEADATPEPEDSETAEGQTAESQTLSVDAVEDSEGAGAPAPEGQPAAPDGAAETPASETELTRLQLHLDRLVVQQAYEEAARVRDQIRRLSESDPAPQSETEGPTC
jgi:bifunctional DNase/RNase